ncbi:hypothetical protein ACH5RR_008980 [Cinchona calisaya]|uniref:Uncharacterized protein n=1 Tax=Cinchona calisaya TaxID=153742 RepID=A0ABD3AET3_9GENT
MEVEKLAKHSKPAEVEMENKVVDEMVTPQKAGTRVKHVAKKKTPKKVRKQGVAAAINANSKASSTITIIEDAARYMEGEKLAKHSEPAVVRK